MFHFPNFTIGDMTKCGTELRKLGMSSTSMEETAAKIVDYLYNSFFDPQTGQKDLALVRLFKTHNYKDLPPELKAFSDNIMPIEEIPDKLKCLTLLASKGNKPEWNSRHSSVGHKAIPLPSIELVRKFPMISNLVKQFGLELNSVINPDSGCLQDLEEKTYNMFFVSQAKENTYIPAQDDFVLPHNIQSVLGYGGMLPSGNLFAVIMFSKLMISKDISALFKPLTLNIKTSLLKHDFGTVLVKEKKLSQFATTTPKSKEGRKNIELKAQVAALEQLIDVHETTVVEQSRHLERTLKKLNDAQIALEVEKRKKIEAALRESESRFRSIFQDVPDAIGIANTERQIVLINPAFSNIFGYCLEEIQGKKTAILYESHEEFEYQGQLRFNLDAKEKNPEPYVVNYSRKNGEIFSGETVSTVIKDEDGNTVAYLSVIRDITERKAAEKELQEINTALRVLLKSREKDQKSFEERVLFNVKKMVTPHVERLKTDHLSQDQLLHLTSLEKNLDDIVSSFSHTLSVKFLDLTPTEILVANHTKQGRTAKEIASLLHVSVKTVEAHRYNIRKKLSLNRKKGNLRSLLISSLFPTG